MDDAPGLDDDFEPPRRKRWLLPVAAVVVLALVSTYALSELLQTEVLPRVRSGGSAESFGFLRTDPVTGRPVRYNPCEALHFVINLEHAPAGGVDDVGRGIRMMSAESGIELVLDGETTERPSPRRPLYQPRRYTSERWAPVLLAWVPQNELLPRGRHPAGSGGSVATPNRKGRLVYVTGTITLNADAPLLPGYDLGNTWGDVILHELGHVLGLAHVEDPGQIMFPNVTTGSAALGEGDRAGLARLGRRAGCVTIPRPHAPS
ncbi:MAG: matrixin family metalloprotease [Actinomycetota bacterium]|nr:matrixin family metalloprotease [Actinomycetota bacterium]